MLSRFEIFCISPQENFFGLCLFVFFFCWVKMNFLKLFLSLVESFLKFLTFH